MIPTQTLSIHNHQPTLWKKSKAIYLVTLTLVVSAIGSLPFIKTTISIKSTGIIRPQTERTDIKPSIGGLLESLLIKEGDLIQKGQLLAVIQDRTTAPRIILNLYEQKQRQDFIADLTRLTRNEIINPSALETPLYRLELSRFLSQYAEQEADIKKLKKELEINYTLLISKAIAPKEYFDKETEIHKRTAAVEAFRFNQQTNWQNELNRYKIELSQIRAQRLALETEKQQHKIYAPLTGIVQNCQHHYTGKYIQAGESLCTISPQTELMAECMVSAARIGLIQMHQQVQFQIDAFDYNYFGIITGKVISIDNDFSLIDNKPIFKVRCSFNQKQLFLKNGYKGILKKGLTLQARFIINERTLWQLLFDRIDNWLNPNTPIPLELTAP